MADLDALRSRVGAYYGAKVSQFGTTARGVDWNSEESQRLRFEQLLRVCDRAAPGFSLNDYGCGYGALVDHLAARGLVVDYRGFDIAEEMLSAAAARHTAAARVTFQGSAATLEAADLTVASGVFNVKLDTPRDDWERYVFDTLDEIRRLSRSGFAFNMLTSYSDPQKRRPDLYYGDPCAYFDRCKRRYSRHVALLHDYGLYEFTVLVRLE